MQHRSPTYLYLVIGMTLAAGMIGFITGWIFGVLA